MSIRSIATTAISLALLGLLICAPATAQKGGFEIAIGAGLTDLDEKLGGDSGWSLDLRAGYFATDRFEVELQNNYASSIVKGSFQALTLNGIYHFGDASSGTGVPYVLIGAGVADVEFDRLFRPSVDDEGTALRAAFGARFWFGDRQRSSGRIELSVLNEDSFDDDATHFALTGLFGWRFGG